MSCVEGWGNDFRISVFNDHVHLLNCDVDWSDPNSGLVKVEFFFCFFFVFLIQNRLKQNRKHKYRVMITVFSL